MAYDRLALPIAIPHMPCMVVVCLCARFWREGRVAGRKEEEDKKEEGREGGGRIIGLQGSVDDTILYRVAKTHRMP